MVAFARNANVPAPVRGGSRVAAGTRNGVLRDGKYEGRLVKTESLPSVPDAARVRVENVYDYRGRRVEKTVSSDYSGGVYSTTNVTTFVYDGWLPVAETTDDGTSISTNFNVWGLDLSGTFGGSPRPSVGAGGVGGLLATVQDGDSYFVCMDGNGNVCQYVETSGAAVASREYDPFGGTVVLTGSQKHDFAIWFSTKLLDEETGLYVYTFRYYDPELGRWLNRDPLGERGGDNLYAFVQNMPIEQVDAFGLLIWSKLIEMLEGTEVKEGQSLSQVLADVAQKFRNISNNRKGRFLETCLCGTIDLGHFFGLAGEVVETGDRTASLIRHGDTEFRSSLRRGGRTAFRDDLPSNAFGALFGEEFSASGKVDLKSMVFAVKQFLSPCKPLDNASIDNKLAPPAGGNQGVAFFTSRNHLVALPVCQCKKINATAKSLKISNNYCGSCPADDTAALGRAGFETEKIKGVLGGILREPSIGIIRKTDQ